MKEFTSCFIGIPLPSEYQAEFEKLLKDVKNIDPDLSTVYPKTPHLTVYYLDKQSQLVLPEIAEVVKKHASLLKDQSLSVGKYGFFRPGNPQVIFLDVQYPSVLKDFNQLMVKNLSQFFASNNNLPFHPHMTVAYIENQESFRKQEERIKARLEGTNWKFPITDVVLYGVDSTRTPQFQEKLIQISI